MKCISVRQSKCGHFNIILWRFEKTWPMRMALKIYMTNKRLSSSGNIEKYINSLAVLYG